MVKKVTPNNMSAVIIASEKYSKDKKLSDIKDASAGNAERFASFLDSKKGFNINKASYATLINEEDQLKIKEGFLNAISKNSDEIIVYYSGVLIFRKEQIYLSTPNSTLKEIFANGIPLLDIINILKENKDSFKIFMVDGPLLNENGTEIKDRKDFDTTLKSYTKGDSFAFLMPSASKHKSYNEEVIQLFEEGVEVKTENLTVGDLTKVAEDKNTLNFIYSDSVKKDTSVCSNEKYKSFQKLLAEGDKLFSSEAYSKALPKYEKAIELFEDKKATEKTRFIKELNKGEDLFSKNKFNEAYDSFLRADDIISSKVVHKGIIKSLEKVGESLLEKRDYAQAREVFLKLQKENPKLKKYQTQVELCDNELNFQDFLEKADSYYFQNNFEEALPNYTEALKIKDDFTAKRRKGESEWLVKKLKEIGSTSGYKVVEETKSKPSTNTDSAIEEKAWEKAEDLNTKSAYEFYVSIFPEGKYASQAAEKIANYDDIQATDLEETTDERSTYSEEPKVIKKINPESGRISLSRVLKEGPEEEEGYEDFNITHTTADEESQVFETIDEKSDDGETVEEITPVEENTFKEDLSNIKDGSQVGSVAVDFESYSEEELWDYAESGGTIESYMDYINNTKEAIHVADAYYMINKMTKENEEKEKKESFEQEIKIDDVSENGEVPEEKEDEQEDDILTESISQGEDQKEDLSFIADLSEDGLWNYAQKVNTVESYMLYVENTSESTHIADAYSKINELNHQNDTEESESVSDQVVAQIKQEERFTDEESQKEEAEEKEIVKEPENDEIKINLDIFNSDEEEEKLWEDAKNENTISSYSNYLDGTKSGKYSSEAESKIEELKNDTQTLEQQDWIDAQVEDTSEAYKNYMDKYPTGKYYAKATFRLEKLEEEQNKV